MKIYSRIPERQSFAITFKSNCHSKQFVLKRRNDSPEKLVREEIEKTWHPRWSISYRCDLGLGKVALVRFESDQLTAFSVPHFFLPPLLLSSPTLRSKPPQRSSRRSSLLPQPSPPSLSLWRFPASSYLRFHRGTPSGGRFHGRLTLVASIASTNGQLFFGISMLSHRDPGNVLDLVTDNSSPRILVIYGVDLRVRSTKPRWRDKLCRLYTTWRYSILSIRQILYQFCLSMDIDVEWKCKSSIVILFVKSSNVTASCELYVCIYR